MDYRSKLMTWGAAPVAFVAVLGGAGAAYADHGEPGEGAGTASVPDVPPAPVADIAGLPVPNLQPPGIGSLGSPQPAAVNLSGLLPMG
ncbi:hypothetical protein AB0M28_05105 [Streptomyces sp. NPDC051940]|uniref:hypothetical protein n=1 Tax=Streptomyces sp. NPDC051940 TaxID=3155675 RepID=UPI003414E8DF